MNETQTKTKQTDPQQPMAKLSRYETGESGELQGNPPSLRSLRVEAEIYAISRALEYTGWNRRRAAQLLSISYRGILYKIRQHNLTPGPRAEQQPVGQMLKVESQS
jgi:DNA-binding NtrC family response regulator